MNEEEKIKKLKTSELLDKLNVELKKENSDDYLVGVIETEINDRDPFKYIETRIEGDEDGTTGLVKDIEELEKEVKELRKLLKNHDHKDGEVVVKL